MSKYFKNSTKKKSAAAPPRQMKDIDTEYRDLCGRAGDAQYKLVLLQNQLSQINNRLTELTQEASARNQADQAAAKSAEVATAAPVVEDTTSGSAQ